MATLSDKTALVTGASRGMGRSTALKLAQQGARVVVHYGNAVTEAEEVVGLIRTAGGRQMPSAPTSRHPMPRTASPRRFVSSLAIGSIFWSPTPAPRRR